MVEATKLTREQAAALRKALAPHLGYLFRLRQRCEKTGLAGNDSLDLSVCKAYDGMHGLAVRTHYLSCEGGVG